ncbi:MAG TPA: arsenosugar biosynthesis radical SAM (seleno)protein ArsS [Burkholderiales bacterium]|nr:arsenosugar biosynthesis radical SAM (seleno)protein ArsS [Burkholderiales bacterium]
MGAPETRELSGPRATTSLVSRASSLASAERQLQVLQRLELADFKARLRPAAVEIFQINVGKLCNMTCRHCHVDAGPDRTAEMMSRETVDLCLAALDRTNAGTVDITGGAPELNPHFRYLVDQCVARGKRVIDRCNLTVLLTGPCRDLPGWFAQRGVEIVCSLPHYRKRNTDLQRGDGTFEKSIEALQRLNAVGYGKGDPRLRLVLMHNPVGAFLSGDQKSMEKEWKQGLAANHGVTFDALISLNNMPISRFLEWLETSGNLQAYMELLLNAYNPATVPGLMCRNTISVGWDGRLYDCDFNQMLELEARSLGGAALHIRDFDPARLRERSIVTARHCYGCTAGAGSSCGGAVAG